MIEFEAGDEFPKEGKEDFKSLPARIKVVGVGGAGCSIVSRISSQNWHHVNFTVCDSSVKTLARCEHVEKLLLGTSVTRGWGTGGNKELAKRIAEDARDRIKGVLNGTDLFFLICSLGKGLGAGASPVILKVAKEMGIVSVGFFVLPFSFEEGESMAYSEKVLEDLWELVDGAVIVSNNVLLRLEKADAGASFIALNEIFTRVDGVFETLLHSIENMLYSDGVIGLDFADITSFLAKGKQVIITTGEGSGERCVEEAIEGTLYSPIWGEVSLSNAKGILVGVRAGETFRLSQLERIILFLRQRADPLVPITFGVYTEQNLSDKLILTLMTSNTRTLALKHDKQEKAYQQELRLNGYSTKDLDVPTFLRKRDN